MLNKCMIVKDIRGYEGEYTLREDGQVFSIKSNQFIKQRLNRGYLIVTLSKNSKQKHFYVHRLVASHFIGAIPDGMEVNHIDHDKTNNHVSNLEICTPYQNKMAYVNHKRSIITQKHVQKCVEPNLRKSIQKDTANDFCKRLNEYKQLLDGYHQLLNQYHSYLLNQN